MKKHLLIILALMPLALFAQENNEKNLSFGLKAWNETENFSSITLINDTIVNHTELNSWQFSGFNPYIGFHAKKSGSWQIGLSEFYLGKKHTRDWDQFNASSKIAASNEDNESFNFNFETFGLRKIKTTKRYLPEFFIQMNLKMAYSNFKPLVAEVFPSNYFLISNKVLFGFEYNIKLKEMLSLDLGLQLPLYTANFINSRVQNPAFSVNQQKTSQFRFNSNNSFLPQFRLGISYSL